MGIEYKPLTCTQCLPMDENEQFYYDKKSQEVEIVGASFDKLGPIVRKV